MNRTSKKKVNRRWIVRILTYVLLICVDLYRCYKSKTMTTGEADKVKADTSAPNVQKTL